MKRFIAVVMFILITLVWASPGTCLTDRFVRTYDKTQTFNKPIVEKNSKVGVWKGTTNMGMTDPKNVYVFEDEFVSESASLTANADTWLSVQSVTIQDDAPGGEIWMTSVSGSANNMQVNGESFQLTDETRLYYETRVEFTDIDKMSWFVGLAITDQDILGAITDAIGFKCPDNTGDIDFCVYQDSYEDCQDTGFDLEDNTMVRLAFSTDGSYTTQTIMAYINDNPLGISSTFTPHDEALTPSYEIAVTDTASDAIKIDYIKIIADR